MYCPQCGQQQASEMRFCSRCGFPLGGVAELLTQGGILPTVAAAQQQGRELSPRQKGTREGVMLMCSSLLVVPIVSLLSVFVFGGQQLLIPLAAILTFVGGLLRIIYARLYEADTPGVKQDSLPYVSPAQLSTGTRSTALPPPQSTPIPSFMPRRANTAELVPPPSVTENTTRLLDEEKATRNE